MSDIVGYYSGFDEWGRLDREPLEFKVNWHFIQAFLPRSGNVLDNGAGPGKYAMALAERGYRVTLTDITPGSVTTARDKAAEFHYDEQFADFLVRDARELSGIEDDSFDAALMMGPLYHLQSEADRDQATRELRRVTKAGGVVFVAVRPRIRKILTALTAPEQWKPLDDLRQIKAFRRTGVFDHADKGRFTGAYFFNIEDIVPFFEQHGFETLKLISSTGIGGSLSKENWEYWIARGQEKELMELICESADDPYILGATASHLLYIGRKR